MTVCPACSFDFRPKQRNARSIPQHRRFFGMVRAAYHQWPDNHEFQPTDATELRKWLTAKAGYVERRIIEAPPEIIADDDDVRASAMQWMENALAIATRSHEHVWVRRWNTNFVVFVPKSIAFDQMGPQEFGMLCDKVSDVIFGIMGVDGDELLLASKAAAT